MSNRQFNFSLSVSGVLVLLGALLSSLANIGIALVALGLAIAALAVLNRGVVGAGDEQEQTQSPEASRNAA